ncbi:cache domain-containing sensor histidine kinase [Paenibacillus luteus]|uniref:cache domain-containing sensor histidine kinase n=1 Tax=Paenibacillus luteus TaxID=2545753 RepID=UPI001143C8B0|nr:sensor histidine kinase [Paenibacillus luteus]
MRTYITALFNNMKLKEKFLFSYLIIIVSITLLISLANYYISETSLKQISYNYSEYLMSQIGNNMETLTSDLDQTLLMYVNAEDVFPYLRGEAESNYFLQYKAINRKMIKNLEAKPYLMGAFVQDKQEQWYHYNFVKNTVSEYRHQLNIDLQEVKDYKGSAKWTPGEGDEEGAIIVSRALYDPGTYEYLGIIGAIVEDDYIRSIYHNVDRVDGGEFFIFNENGQLLIYDTPDRKRYINQVLASHDLSLADGQTSFRNEGKDYIATTKTITDKKWKLVNIISVNELRKHTDALKYWIFYTCLIAMIGALILAYLFSHQITANVRKLLNSIKHISQGNFKVQATIPKGRDEIAILGTKFNQMSEQIEQLIDTVTSEKLLKQEAEYKSLAFEYKALQAQINPHFLYNTLEFINCNALMLETDKVSQMVCLLGDLLRDTFRNKKHIITLEEELHYIKKYLDIHQTIYTDKIFATYEIDSALLQTSVPNFILQPIVENAIVHGMEGISGMGLIQIVCRRENDLCIIEIKDNGIGIAPDIQESLLRVEDTERREDEHYKESEPAKIGIRSVNKRVKLMFGAAYGLSIVSMPGTETVVSISIPLQTASALYDKTEGE